MAFFDDFKRSASSAAEKAAKKTEELKNIAKYNVNIKSLEGKLSATYEQIGRLFYEAERNGEDYTADIAAEILKADKYHADIAEYKKLLAKLRKVSECPTCGKEIDENALFCSFCGAKQEKPVVEEEIEVEEPAEEAEEAADTFAEECTFCAEEEKTEE